MVVVLFDAWHEIGRDGVCEYATDLISQCQLCLSDSRLYRSGNVLSQITRHQGSMQKRVRAMWNLMNFELKGSTSLLFSLKWHEFVDILRLTIKGAHIQFFIFSIFV